MHGINDDFDVKLVKMGKYPNFKFSATKVFDLSLIRFVLLRYETQIDRESFCIL